MGLKGKFVRRDGTMAIFGSQKKPEWKGIDISSRVDPSSLIPGEYYELEMDGQSLVGVHRLEPRGSSSTYTPGKEGGGYAKPAGTVYVDGLPIPREDRVSMNSLMASATGFAKSAMESGICKTWPDAAAAGIAWAERWGEVPPPKVKAAPAPEYPQDPEDPF